MSKKREIVLSLIIDKITRAEQIIMQSPVPKPLKPSNIFVELDAHVIPKGTTNKIKTPKLTSPKYGKTIISETKCPKGIANRKGKMALTLCRKRSKSSNIPISPIPTTVIMETNKKFESWKPSSY